MNRIALFTAALITFAHIEARADVSCRKTPEECHFDDGQALLASDPEAAAVHFLASYRLAKNPETLVLYAVALQAGHHFAKAFENLTLARVELAAKLETASPDQLDALHQQIAGADSGLAALASLTGHVTLKYPETPAPTGIVVARKGGGDIADPFTKPIAVDDNDDTIVVTYPDGKTTERRISAGPGTDRTVVIPAPTPTSTPVTLAQPPRDPPPVSIPQSRSSSSNRLGVVLTTAGAVALAAGGGLELESLHTWSNAEHAGCTDSGCPMKAQPIGDRANLYNELAIASAVAGVGLAVVGVYLLVHHGSHSSVSVGFAPGLSSASAFVMGRF